MPYKVIENKDIKVRNKAGVNITIPKTCEYSIYWFDKNGKNGILIANINDVLKEPLVIAAAFVTTLNKVKLTTEPTI